jgi:hypothetical protein
LRRGRKCLPCQLPLRLVGAGAVQLGGALRLAAYVFHRVAVKARRVRGGVRVAPSGGTQAAAAGLRLCEVRRQEQTRTTPPQTPSIIEICFPRRFVS